jgi:hypothetical protein
MFPRSQMRPKQERFAHLECSGDAIRSYGQALQGWLGDKEAGRPMLISLIKRAFTFCMIANELFMLGELRIVFTHD